jgi:hypothetical protein
MKAFRDKRSVLWLTGVVVLLAALFVAFVVVPARTPLDVEEGVHVDVPGMQNVPPPGAQRLKLEPEREQ